jgi:uncharacterized protein (DUF2267 family)
VAHRTGQPADEARQLTEATFATLAERLTARQARELSGHLPASLSGPFEHVAERPDPFPCSEFLARVAGRTGTSPAAVRDDVAAVFATMSEALPATELEYVGAALTDDYAPLLGRAAPAERVPEEPVAAR